MKVGVLHVIGNLGLGGAQSVLYHLWPSLCKSDRYTFELCALNYMGHFGELLRSEGATVHCLECKYKYDPVAIARLRKIVLSGSYKIVHVHLFPELIIAPLAVLGISDIRLVYTEHLATNRRRRLGFVGRMLDRFAYRYYARIIAVNNSTYRNLITWLPELVKRTVLIPNAVNLNFIKRSGKAARAHLLTEFGLSSQTEAKLILFAGRLVHQKGVDILLSSLSQLKHYNYFCLIAGDGPEREKLEAMANSLGINDRVRFLGTRLDVSYLLQQVDFLILPSRYEGLPLIVLEAMAAGCPIVATKVDGTEEVLQHEVSALLVPPEDARALTEAIRRLLEDAELGRRLAGQAQRDAQMYSADRIAEQLIALYDDVLST
jgi:glycosyltransferase involved in cell wall biosynthesis